MDALEKLGYVKDIRQGFFVYNLNRMQTHHYILEIDIELESLSVRKTLIYGDNFERKPSFITHEEFKAIKKVLKQLR